ncbi:hypothetical protein Nocox_13115 [Nonomuraea coxensis DSM 45129]|uniref:Uncharacterized protein n=1 Tax=Nonomuraea coxensis DSM 45129 TaxID=1122611 RepID=A0ABX8TXN7_9ACTN|nr:hypothetical protein [Nonomuraea coxensis]QYC40240.1 hypothetical protein Nocox_13115 [Nonomuraea coxensis DSM 45129]
MFFGLPLHPLVVHAAVVCLPLAALGTVLMAFWPAAARRLWPAVLFVATIALIAVPLSISSGETLADTVGENALIELHEEQGEQVLPFVIALWLATLGFSLAPRFMGYGARSAPHGGAAARPRWHTGVMVVLVLLALAGGIGGTVAIVRAGHSGAESVWT